METKKGYEKIKRLLDLVMKRAVRDVEDEVVRVKLLNATLKIREMLDGK